MRLQSLFEVFISMFISMLIVFAILHYVSGNFAYSQNMTKAIHSANSSIVATEAACGCFNSGN